MSVLRIRISFFSSLNPCKSVLKVALWSLSDDWERSWFCEDLKIEKEDAMVVFDDKLEECDFDRINCFPSREAA